jgi:hypothetical protein
MHIRKNPTQMFGTHSTLVKYGMSAEKGERDRRFVTHRLDWSTVAKYVLQK